MIRISQLTLAPGDSPELLREQAARALSLPLARLPELRLVKESIDARHKSGIKLCYTVELSLPEEESLPLGPGASRYTPQPYRFPSAPPWEGEPPVVVGMGPAGLFAALSLARAGIPVVLLERGQGVERRCRDVERSWRTGEVDPESNVQFGEGGAGTFSDGKLTHGTHDRRVSAVLDTLVEAGAPEDIRWSFRPHIGTDLLREVVRRLREELLELGCQVRFGHRLEGLEARDGQLRSIRVHAPEGTYPLPCTALILAPGHSARDTFQTLQDFGVPLSPKPFAVGVRIEHLQRDVSRGQYGSAWSLLPPSDYKLACHLRGGRSVFSFCVCPGGQVVSSASAGGQIVTNGMSLRARDGENINGGLLCGVGPEDFAPYGSDPLAGMRFQEHWERAAWRLGGEQGLAPAQLLGDFLSRRNSRGPGGIQPTYRPGVRWTALDPCLPPAVTQSLREAIPLLDRKLRGFAREDAVLTGVETRSSSPVRILRGEDCQSPLRGLYPCGEGAGWAGGIVSAAVDGIRVAEAVALRSFFRNSMS